MTLFRFALLSLLLLRNSGAADIIATSSEEEDDCSVEAIGVDTVVTPAGNQTLYNEARSQWASELGDSDYSNQLLAPRAIVYAQDNDKDLPAVLEFATRCQYSLSVRSGGHQYAGHSSCRSDEKKPCLQVDVSEFKKFEIEDDDNIVTLGVGLRLEEAMALLEPHEITIPHGLCKKIGLGGHYQTSSLGMLARAFGLGMDHVLSFRIMTADGTIHNVTRASDPELWDGVLGGAPGSFGVVLDFTIEALRSADYPNTYNILWTWPYSNQLFQDLAAVFNSLMTNEQLNRDLSLYMVVANPTSLRAATGDIDTHLIILYGIWTGIDSQVPMTQDISDLYLKPFEDIAPPTKALDAALPLHMAQSPYTVDFNFDKYRFWELSLLSSKSYPEADAYKLMADQIDAWISIPSVWLAVDLQPWGGMGSGTQLNRNVGLNGFPQRDYMMSTDHWIMFGDESIAEELRESIESYVESFKGTSFYSPDRQWGSTFSIEALEADLAKDGPELYYPQMEQYQNLLDLKTRMDPNDVFGTAMTIPLVENLETTIQEESLDESDPGMD